MFHVRAAFDERLEIKTSAERARAFFCDLRNFVELMPGVERITAEAGGVMRWLIRADVPVIGVIRQAFVVAQTDDRPLHIEWSPAPHEKRNLLRYAAIFEPRADTAAAAPKSTLIRIIQRVELRRQHARELHMLAGLVGERRLSSEMQKGVTEMMRVFLGRARARREGRP